MMERLETPRGMQCSAQKAANPSQSSEALQVGFVHAVTECRLLRGVGCCAETLVQVTCSSSGLGNLGQKAWKMQEQG